MKQTLLLAAMVVLVVSFVADGGLAPDDRIDVEAPEPAELEAPEHEIFEWIPFPLPPTTCGGNICGVGQYCCNPSCGACVDFGNFCTQEVCAPTS